MQISYLLYRSQAIGSPTISSRSISVCGVTASCTNMFLSPLILTLTGVYITPKHVFTTCIDARAPCLFRPKLPLVNTSTNRKYSRYVSPTKLSRFYLDPCTLCSDLEIGHNTACFYSTCSKESVCLM